MSGHPAWRTWYVIVVLWLGGILWTSGAADLCGRSAVHEGPDPSSPECTLARQVTPCACGDFIIFPRVPGAAEYVIEREFPRFAATCFRELSLETCTDGRQGSRTRVARIPDVPFRCDHVGLACDPNTHFPCRRDQQCEQSTHQWIRIEDMDPLPAPRLQMFFARAVSGAGIVGPDSEPVLFKGWPMYCGNVDGESSPRRCN